MQVHVDRGGERYGPYSLEKVNAYMTNGTLLPTDLAWQPVRAQPLAERFGVSRGSVRDALLQLSQEGVLVYSPNRGVRVRSVRMLIAYTLLDDYMEVYEER